ncbi:MAG: hypothetical protein IPM39_13780 [Chloroflexi bacterium]|nr:hypothetical protein [Chloroflexota bacterium]
MKRIHWLLILVVIMSLALAACGGGEEPAATAVAETAPVTESNESAPPTAAPPTAAPPTAVPPTAVPTATSEPEQASVAFADLNFGNKMEALSSYRYEMVMTVSGTDESGTPTSKTMTMQMAFTNDPQASSISVSGDGIPGMEEASSIEIVQIGSTSYMVFPEMGCVAFPAEEEDLLQNDLAQEFNPETMFRSLDDLTLVGEDTINGIRVLHYTFDESDITTEDAQGLMAANGDLFIAKDGGYLVRLAADMNGDALFMEGFEEIKDAVMRMEFNVTDINQPFEIIPPAGCEGQGPDAELPFPVVENATDVINFPGVIGYSTTLPPADVIAFYQEAMADAGYTYAEGQSFITDSAASLTFDGSSGAVSVTISDSNGVTSVAILYETGS